MALSEHQKNIVDLLLEKINSGDYKLIKKNCICGNTNTQKDILIKENDKFGFPINYLLCQKCGLIRADKVFDKKSNELFYKDFYRKMYFGNKYTVESRFQKMSKSRGNKLYKLLNSHSLLDSKNINICEIGSGSGYNIYKLYQNGFKCVGYDYDKEDLSYGLSMGIDLKYGNYNQIEENSQDIILLYHVLEHCLNPISEFRSIIKKIKPLGHIVFQVPSFLNNKSKLYNEPYKKLHISHIFYYYMDFLKVFCNKVDLKVIYCDETCTFICQKPNDWQKNNISYIYDKSLKDNFVSLKSIFERDVNL